MSVYWASCVTVHVVSMVPKSQSQILACLSYILFIAYCASDEVDYFWCCTCVMCVNGIYVFCLRALDCSCGSQEGADGALGVCTSLAIVREVMCW